MARHSIIDQIEIRKLCDADWNSMAGNDEIRFCEHCAKDVHNLSAMTRVEAERLVANSSGKLCVRYYPHTDGGIETIDKTRRVYLLTRKIFNVAAGLFTVMLAASSTALTLETSSKQITIWKPEKKKDKTQIGKPAGSVSGKERIEMRNQ